MILDTEITNDIVYLLVALVDDVTFDIDSCQIMCVVCAHLREYVSRIVLYPTDVANIYVHVAISSYRKLCECSQSGLLEYFSSDFELNLLGKIILMHGL